MRICGADFSWSWYFRTSYMLPIFRHTALSLGSWPGFLLPFDPIQFHKSSFMYYWDAVAHPNQKLLSIVLQPQCEKLSGSERECSWWCFSQLFIDLFGQHKNSLLPGQLIHCRSSQNKQDLLAFQQCNASICTRMCKNPLNRGLYLARHHAVKINEQT